MRVYGGASESTLILSVMLESSFVIHQALRTKSPKMIIFNPWFTPRCYGLRLWRIRLYDSPPPSDHNLKRKSGQQASGFEPEKSGVPIVRQGRGQECKMARLSRSPQQPRPFNNYNKK
ncbi:conserved hypothetical protein [Trichinella spiralis]|uniref:hypothetical protein n=1 Tax=Trichinella spiralis TaxID=6334 RepID=UPI0001EFBEF7|nr:conserved hypothetical protein [Trichinella spiralis]